MKMHLVGLLQFIISLPTFTLGLECDTNKWTCSDYANNFEKELENTLKCLEYDYRQNPLEALGTPDSQLEILVGDNTRKIKSLDTELMVSYRNQ